MPDDRYRGAVTELVDWLVSIEGLAYDVYTAAADALRADAQLSAFVALLADNEKQHAELMGGVREKIADMASPPPPDVRLDAGLRENVETPLRQLRLEVASGIVTHKRAMSLIAEVEFTEWNEIFLYVLGKYGRQGREMEMTSATIQQHERSIESFIAQLPPHLRPELDVARLAKIWETRLLLVDDNRIVRELLAGILKPVGQVIAMENGEQALEALRSRFFDAVVSDLRMPGMRGIDLYRQAVAEHADLRNRFVFLSFDPSKEDVKYLTDHHLPLLLKPFGPEELTEVVYRITTTPQSANKTDPGDGG